MIGQELIIKFDDDKAYLTEDKFLTFNQLDLPSFVKRFKSPAAWVIKVLNYFPAERKVVAEIISYKNNKMPFSNCQYLGNSDINEIDKITFRNIDTYKLSLTISGNASGRAIIPDKEQRPQDSSVPFEYEINTIKESFHIPLKNVRFKLGCVAFDKYIKRLNKTVEFTVANNNIREEFDAVKNYFANILKAKKFQFDIEIQLADGDITNIETKSQEVSRIDQKLIEDVKFEFVKSFTKKKIDNEKEKSLFTMEEVFDVLTDDHVKANVFYENENQLVNDLIQITKTKHYNHLRYLSSKHVHSIMKLRFVIKPFSFVFLIEGEYNYHIVWETLDTAEATYIWHEDKNLNKLKNTLREIDDKITVIKVQGKSTYINTTEDCFRRIYHDYSRSVDGFIKWKEELEKLLT